MLDVRTPIGLMFGAIGLLLIGYGLTSSPAIYRVSLGYNLNLWWGLAMLSFALVMIAWQQLNPQVLEHQEEPPAEPSQDVA